jgi:hypothetical protein
LEETARDHPGKRIEPWFEDEARFGQQGSLARIWGIFFLSWATIPIIIESAGADIFNIDMQTSLHWK